VGGLGGEIGGLDGLPPAAPERRGAATRIKQSQLHTRGISFIRTGSDKNARSAPSMGWAAPLPSGSMLHLCYAVLALIVRR